VAGGDAGGEVDLPVADRDLRVVVSAAGDKCGETSGGRRLRVGSRTLPPARRHLVEAI
jgi:hypothetical protein